ncbi:non-ribosomal peptide synthetase [Amycolatopsis nigrescens]|uniref:non-ribosomal peptide synthetase n=1 Tax=Amycolatopsis nigrescens TaxID=381445 RepID=UPI0003A2D876|nr:non-ribosomal peptide synthetase [Amycolatopsis nigrescens]
MTVPEEPTLALTGAQAGIWLAQQVDELNPTYNTAEYVEITGAVDESVFVTAVHHVLAEADGLRVRFSDGTDGPVQRVRPLAGSPLVLVDLRGEADPEAAARDWMRADLAAPVDLLADRLYTEALLRLGDERYFWFQRFHHILLDAYGFTMVTGRVAEVYTALAAGESPGPSPFRPLRELVEEDLAYRGSADLDRDRRFWTERLAGLSGVPGLSDQYAAPDHSFHRRSVALGGARELSGLAAELKSTWAEVLIAAAAAYLHRCAGADEVVLGLPVMGRLGSVAARVPATAVNVVPLRLAVSPWTTVAELTASVRAELRAQRPHQRYRGEELRRDLRLLGERRRLVGPWINIKPFDPELRFGAHRGVSHYLAAGAVEDLSFTVSKSPGDELLAQLDGNPRGYRVEELDRHLRAFTGLLGQFAEGRGSLPVGALTVTAGDEPVATSEGPVRELPEAGLAELFQAQVASTPDAPALLAGGLELSYQDLNARADRLARRLSGLGATAERLVAVLLPRSADLVATLLAVAKTGAAYLPLDPEFPPRRLAAMLADAGPAVLVTESETELEVPAGVARLRLDDEHPTSAVEAPVRRRPEHAAYVIYTSGSTGRPKGVVVSSANLANFLHAMRTQVPLGPGDRLLAVTTVGFDIAALELYLPLVQGATVVLADREQVRDPALLTELLRRTDAGVVQATPSLWETLAGHDAEVLRGRRVLAGGERLPAALADRLRGAGAVVSNLYGPTETTIWSAAHQLDATEGDPPIGAPVLNTRLYVLDRALAPVGTGTVGELYIAGAGVARGYLGRAALTAERFVADPYGPPGSVCYRTGDLARSRGDGTFDVLGRADHQVKVRGFRIEPGEIEAELLRRPEVTRAVVVADPGGRQRLVAYLVAAPDLDPAGLRKALGEVLPDYLVPSAFVVLDELPLTPNGKIDRAALPAPTSASGQAGTDRVTGTPAEQVLCRLFGEVLGLASVGPGDDFFGLGGDSLSAIRLVARIRAVLGAAPPVRKVFDSPTPAGLVGELTGTAVARPSPVAGATGRVPLSYAQEQLWFSDRMSGHGATYNVPLALRLTGALDVPALAAAVADLVARHESLRTVFDGDTGQVAQVVLDDGPELVIVESEMDGFPAALAAAARRPLDLGSAPPVEFRLFHLGDEEHVLLVLLHHIVADEWSLDVLVEELAEAYTARLGGTEPAWPRLPLCYRDFTRWQTELLGDPGDPGSVAAAQLDYWRGQLAGLPEELELPADRSRPARPTGAGDALAFTVPEELHARLRACASRYRVSMFMLVHAALAALLNRLGAGTDLPIGVPAAGRTDDALDRVVGFFVNPLVLRTDLAGNPSFAELLDRVRDTDLAALAHQDLPFARLVEALNPVRSTARHPLFQVMLDFRTEGTDGLGFGDLGLNRELVRTGTAKFDLAFALIERAGTAGLSGEIEFSTELFDRDTVAGIARWLVTLLDRATAEPDRPLATLDVLCEDELAERVRLGKGRMAGLAPETTPSIFERQVTANPSAVALLDDETELSYAELNARANRLAHALIRRGAGPERTVAVLLPRSIDVVVALLAVHKAGAVFVPVDPDYPAERVGYVLADSAPELVLTTGAIEMPVELPRLVLDDQETLAELAGLPDSDPTDADRLAPLRPANAAYLIYTSGSTGRPKGVVSTHEGIAGLVETWDSTVTAGPGTRHLQFASPSFDMMFSELAMSVFSGGALAVVPAEQRLGPELAAFVTRHRLTHLDVPPSALATVPAGSLPAGMTVIVGADHCPPTLFERWSPGHPMFNAYGPTESTVNSTLWTCPRGFDGGRVAIGRPDVDKTAYVLDDGLRPVPPGVAGELYLGGAGLARGYLHQPGLTAQRFVADPFGSGDQVYRTGDRVRWTPDGQLEMLGRVDDQVKIRGFRVEPAEVEAAVLGHPDVTEAVVVARDHDLAGKQLVGYVVGERLEPAELRRHTAALLPAHQVPAAFVVLDELPLLPNRKVDRRALPDPEPGGQVTGTAPRTALQRRLCELFAEVLGLPEIGIDDDFFAVGGHSLLATRLIGLIRAELSAAVSLRDVFEAPTVRELAMRAADGTPRLAPRPMARPERLPLSPAQHRLWLADRLDGGATYNVPVAVELSGPFDRAALRAALGDVMARHEILRTVYPERDGVPWQRVLPPGEDLLARCFDPELVVAGPASLETLLARLGREHRFDLAAEPPLRARILRAGPEEHTLFLLLHHIACDEWSLEPLLGDLAAAYRARAAGTEPRWRPLPVQYADYTLWQRELLGDGADPASLLARQAGYWSARLDGMPAAHELPFTRGASSSSDGGYVDFTPSEQALRGVRRLAAETGTTPFMVLQAAVAALLTRLGAGTDVPLGTPVAGRGEAALDGMVGFLVNTLVLRTDTGGDPAFRELLGRVRETDLAAFARQELPFDRLVEVLNPDRSEAANPLFRVMLVHQNRPGDADWGALAARVTPVRTPTAKFDLTFAFAEHGDGTRLDGTINYRSALFQRADVARLAGWFCRFLEAVVHAPETRIGSVELLSADERRRVLVEWNSTGHPESESTPDELFAAGVRHHPDAIALVAGDVRLSYAELDVRVTALAARLRRHGIGRESRVALAYRRSVELVVAMLAAGRAGAAYVPVQPDLPAARTALLLRETGAALVLTTSGHGSVPGVGEVPVLHTDLPDPDQREVTFPSGHPAQLAYVMFTSGSTGTPKGVAVTMGDVTALAADSRWRGGAHERVLLHSPHSFDAVTYELWVPLLTGGRVILAPDTELDAGALRALITEHEVTGLWLTAGLFAVVAEEAPETFRGLREVWTGGDVVPAGAVRRVLAAAPEVAVVNGYGPTETTTFAVAHQVSPDAPPAAVVPIGRPLDGMRAYLLDSALRPVGAGVTGELYLAGAGLARGYFNRPGLTAERFVADPFGEGDTAARSASLGGGGRATGGLLYRTGDLARWRPDGTIEFAGRADEQLKIRGFRIEPGEVAAALTGHPGVRRAAVAAREDAPGDRRLVAYLLPEPGVRPEPGELRAYLGERLPKQLVPEIFLTLDEFPLTANGKLDLAALPAPEAGETAESRRPRTPREELLCEVFADLLGREQLGIDDDFFALGGHSLLAIRLVSRLRSAFDARLSVRAVFEAPTVAGLSALLGAGGRDRLPLRARPRPDRLPLSFAQQRLWFLHQLEGASPTYHVPIVLRLSGELDHAALAAALRDVLARHESLRTVFPDDGGRPRQRILPAADVPLEIEEVDVAPGRLDEELAAAARVPFDLADGIQLRATLFSTGPRERVLLLVAHHIVADEWSLRPLVQDLATAYRARLGGAAPSWPPLPVQYADYTLWQRELLGDQADPDSVLAGQVRYWRDELRGLPEELTLPWAGPRPATPSYRGEVADFRLPPEQAKQLREFAVRSGSSVFMVCQIVVAALLSRLGAGTDIPLGTPVAGREDEAQAELVGFFVNTLVLRNDLAGDPSLRELAERSRRTVLGALDHADVPFEQLVDELRPMRSLARHPLFQVLVSYQRRGGDAPSMPGLRSEVDLIDTGTAKFDLTFALTDEPDGAGISGAVVADAGIFGHGTARRLAEGWRSLLAAMVGAPETPLSRFELLSGDEREKVLGDWAGGTTTGVEATLAELFEAQVARTPDRTAVLAEESPLSYRELNTRSNRLARLLVAHGAGPERFVGICLPRTPDLLVAVLAVLKSGAGYLPLDPAYPPDRLAFMAADAEPVLVLGSGLPLEVPSLHLGDDPDLPGHDLDQSERLVPVLPEHPAYAIYTSGSTGRPKGVVVPQRAVAGLADWARAEFGGEDLSRMLVSTSLNFDVSVFEIFAPLLCGGSVELVRDLLETVERTDRDWRPSAISGVPSVLDTVLDAVFLEPGLRLDTGLVVAAGEAFGARSLERVRAALPGARVVNAYGPTEATVYATAWHAPAEGAATPAIGRPAAGTRVYIVDGALRPVPPGVAGELYLGGSGLARGYLNRPGLTAERFVADPFGKPGAHMYRTGDLARWRENGEVEFLGRVDEQVKLRGFRIEPGEIEAALGSAPSVSRAVVVVREDSPGERRLVAYLVPENGAVLDPVRVRAHAAASLPEHMLPAATVVLDALPLNPSGKLDRAALPVPERPEVAYRGPESQTETTLAGIFAELLGTGPVGLDDDFFALGGDSIVSIQLVSRARAAGLLVRPKDVFDHPTVAALAAVAGRVGAVGESDGTGRVPATPIMRWLADRGGDYRRFAQHAVLYTPAGLGLDRLESLVAALADRHDLLRSTLVKSTVDGSWVLEVAEPGTVPAGPMVRRVDARGAELAELVAAEHTRALGELDPEHGDLVRFVWLDRGEERGRLLAVLHHLVVDGVSWRILLPDLAAAWRAATAGEPVLLDPVGTSFREWAQRLHAKDFSAELPLWRAQLTGPDPLLGRRALDPRRDTVAATGHVQRTLPAERTAPLLTTVPRAFHARVHEVLLTALALAVRDRRPARAPVLIAVEGHGRDAGDTDLARTVGWFTSLYPVRLDLGELDLAAALAGGAEAGQAVLRVKEHLRAVPSGGIGFGQLRYFGGAEAADLAAAAPQISFNYLGRVAAGGADWTPAPEAGAGDGVDPGMAAAAVLDINASTVDGERGPELRVRWSFAKGVLDESEVEDFADAWFAALDALAAAAAGPGAGLRGPSDFPLLSLTQSDVDELGNGDDEVWPLTPLQQGLLFHSLFDEGGLDVYTVQLVLELAGPVDAERLRAAARAVLDRHPPLRARFRYLTSGAAVQVIPAAIEVPWTEADLTGDPEAALTELLRRDRTERFDPETGPLLRFLLIRLPDGAHRLALTSHHLVTDGWSNPLLVRELLAHYDGTALPRPRPYRDYLSWLGAQDKAAAEAAWAEALAGPVEPTLLAGADAAVRTPVVPEEIVTELSEPATAALTALARRHGVTTSTVLQAALALLLGRLTGRTDVVFGTVVSGRPAELAGVESMIGLFVNTLPVRVRLTGRDTVAGLLAAVQREQAGLLAHQHLGLAEVQRAAGTGELFDTLLVVENYPLDPAERHDGGLSVTGVTGQDATHYPLSILVAQQGNRLRLHFKHRPDLLPATETARIAERLLGLLAELARRSDSPLTEVDPLAGERLDAGECGVTLPVPEKSLAELFAEQVAQRPDETAVVAGGVRLSYAEVDRRAAALAGRLVAEGAGPERLVAVALPRTAEFVVAVLAVARSGAAFLPIDPGYPAERIEFMLADSAPALVLATESTRGALPSGARTLLIEEATAPGPVPSPRWHAGNLAYVVYTSGSTGRPKGVAVSAGALANLYAGHQRTLFGRVPAGRRLRVAHLASFSFDASLNPLLWMVAGHELHLLGEEMRRDPELVLAAFAAVGIDQFQATPSQVEPLLDAGLLTGPTPQVLIALGGEAVSPALWDRLAAAVPAVNLYGPAESTVDVLSAPVEPGVRPALGHPVPNTVVRLLDPWLRPVPDGVTGELYVGGPQLARGYLNRPGLTAERFVADPFGAPGAQLYRTGDLARRDGQGRLEFAGRADRQVKIRGFRIEPAEVEAALARHPSVAASAVLLKDSRLVAYLVPKSGSTVDESAIRELVSAALPDYLIPAAFVPVDELPLSPNGKLDAGRLPEPDFGGTAARERPRDEREEVLTGLFAELLRLPEAGVHDEFFTLGGDSILSIQLVAKARAAGLRLTPRQVFEHRTPAALAQVATTTGAVAADGRDAVGALPLTPVMARLLDRGGPIGRYCQSMLVSLPAGITRESLTGVLQAVLDRHHVLRGRLVPEPVGGHGFRIEPPSPSLAATLLDRVAHTGDDLTGTAARELDRAAGLLDPEAGTLARFVWLDPGYLLLVVHHLAVDGVSWRILLADLAEADTTGAALPATGTPFRRWAGLLAAEAVSARRSAELPLWTGMLAGAEPSPRLDPRRDTVGAAGHVTRTLPAARTAALLTAVPSAFHAGTHEVLLTGLVLALGRYRPANSVLLEIEGHGRAEEIADGTDLSATLGWFTTAFPVRFGLDGIDVAGAMAGGADAGTALKRVKERLRSLPDDGIGFGLLRRLNPVTSAELAAYPAPGIAFNYLGRMDAAAAGGDWSPVPGSGGLGGAADGALPLSHGLTVNSSAVPGPDGPELRVHWVFAPALWSAEEIDRLTELWFTALDGLARHTEGPGAGGHTPSDLSLVSLSQAQIDLLESKWRDQ